MHDHDDQPVSNSLVNVRNARYQQGHFHVRRDFGGQQLPATFRVYTTMQYFYRQIEASDFVLKSGRYCHSRKENSNDESQLASHHRPDRMCALLFLSAPRINAATPGLQPAGFGQDRGWDRPPDAWNDLQRRGFQDGIEGARKDFDNHRRPDVDNRDEYRHPNVPSQLWGAYREGFRRGYDVGMSHLVGAADSGAYVHPSGPGMLRRMNSMPCAARDSRTVSKAPARISTITAVPT